MGSAYDELYHRLGNEDGEKDVYKMAKIRNRKTRDLSQVKCIKDEVDRSIVKDEKTKNK
jgi:hypothetical protein